MSKTTLLIILGGITAIILSALAFFVVLRFGIFQEDTGTVPTPILEVITPTPTLDLTATPTITATADGEATSTATPAATLPATSAAQPTAVEVSTTTVQYVQALTDVNIRSGPGTNYQVIGWVAGGQTAKVTGVNNATGWWRVVCPDGSTGSCWVTGSTQYTKTTNSPVGQIPPTATSTTCTNAASFIADITVPDNSQVVANTTFVKTWRIKNNGTCTWDGRYHLVHAGGPTLSAVVETLQLPATVAPGQTVDLTLTMTAPVTPGNYQSDWKLRTPQGTFFGVGSSNAPLWVKITAISAQPNNTVIAGLIYQDTNQNGVYNSGEPLMANREIWLVPGTACHVRQDAVAITYSGNDGRYTFSGTFNGSFCLGVVGNGGLDDVASIAVASGQTLNDINLRSAVPNMSISGFVWSDYCFVNELGSVFEGNCVTNGSGGYRADGMIQPTETYISGVTVLLWLGSCANTNAVAVSAITDYSGKYVFNNLTPGTYCIYINPTAAENVAPLLPGEMTFPFNGVTYQEIELLPGASAYPVNFGWDFQLK